MCQKKLLVQIKNLCPRKNFGSKTNFGSKNDFGSKKNLSKKNSVPKHFWVKKFGGGGATTVGTSSLDYRKPTYQILTSYYAQNPPKRFGWWWVGGCSALGQNFGFGLGKLSIFLVLLGQNQRICLIFSVDCARIKIVMLE